MRDEVLISVSNKSKVYNACYALLLISFIFCKSSTLGTIFPFLGNLNTFINIFIMLVLIIFVIFEPKTYYRFFIYIALTLITFICYYKAHNIGIIILMLFVLASQNGDFKGIVNVDFYVRTISVGFIVLLSLLRIIPNYISDFNGRYREALGFIHPNTTGAMFLIILLDFLSKKVLSGNKLKLRNYIAILLVIILCDLVVNARSAEVCMVISLILFHFFYKKDEISNGQQKFLIIISIVLVIALPIISILSAKNFTRNNSTYLFLNSLLSGRLDFESQLLQFYSKPTFFGQPLNIVGTINMYTKTNYVTDNSYITSYLGNGIVGLLVLLSLILFIMIKSIRKNNLMLWIWIVALLIWSLSESQLFVISYSLPFLITFSKRISINQCVN